MNLDNIEQLRRPLEALIEQGSRINASKPQKYWYPLSFATYDVEEVLAVVDSLCSFRTTMWDKTAAFEQEFGDLAGGDHNIMVNSGSSADLLIAFAFANPSSSLLPTSGEVLVPSVTWPTQVWSWMMAGYRIRLVDTDTDTLNMDLDDLEEKITPDSVAVSAVHLMGNPCDMDRLMQICLSHNLALTEDCCEALGSRFAGQPLGTFGIASSFSFFFSHHITTLEGGMIHTRDSALADLLRLLRSHGWARQSSTQSELVLGLDPRYTFLNWGFNVRPTELQAGIGLAQLERFESFQMNRQLNYRFFSNEFRQWEPQLQLPVVHPDSDCSWFAIPIMVTSEANFSRSDLTEYLESVGIETRPIVAGNLARHPVAKLFPSLRQDNLPGADYVHQRGFYIGLHPTQARRSLERVLEFVSSFMTQRV